VLANLGIGAVSPDTGVLTAGSSAAVRITCPEPIFDPQRRTWCYRLDDDHYVVGEASNSGGLVLNWFARILGYDSASAMSDELVPDPPYDPVDALLLPTLSGERAPGYQEELRGELIDLALSTTRQDLVIATMEGIGLFCRFIFDDLNRATGAPPHRTILTGQLGRSRPFGNLAPFLFGSCSTRKEMDQSSAVGAAMLGIKATAGVDYKEILSRLPQLEDVEAISSAPFARYLDEKYVRFKEAYEVASSRIKAVEPLGPEG
jgi:gluconokinase